MGLEKADVELKEDRVMEGWVVWVIVLSILIIIWFFSWLNSRLSRLQEDAKKYNEIKPKLEQLDDLEKRKTQFNKEIEIKEARLNREIEKKEEKLKSEIDEREFELIQQEYVIERLVKEKTRGFPWLAAAYNNYLELKDLKKSDNLRHKSHPAPKAAKELRQIAKERREAEKAARISSYLLDYSRYLAPWLDDYIGLEAEELDEIIKDIHSAWEKKEQEQEEDTKRHYGPKYYEGLTPSEKLQKRLDWYWEKPNKSDWQIGRDYERYIGYLYETNGWKVYYYGKKGFEDLGRDLICKKDDLVEIIQCKRWAQEKLIHEKHIYYLFGTTVEYYIDNYEVEGDLQLSLFPELINKKNVIPRLVATTNVSEKAAQVAKVLGVEIDITPSKSFPSVKCNVSRRNGEKIFHLPFDQQYDTALVEEERLECYVGTIAEAEAIGFRHAYRWKGENE